MENYYILQGITILLSCSVVFSCQGGTLLSNGVTEEEKAIILQEHNRLRATVAMGRVPGQPGAENMREIVWDDELAKRAQDWANNCQFRHSSDRTVDRFTMGQNLAILWSTAELAEDYGDFPSRIQAWFDEVQKYAFGSAWSPKTGHYSQLVWGETNLIGCGFSYYKDNKKYNKLYVCNYGPGGNVIGDNPYEVGRPACKNHGMKPSHQYQGLCSSPSTGSQQNSIDTTFTFKSESFTNSKTSYPNQYQAQQPQPQRQQPPPQQQQQQSQKPRLSLYQQQQLKLQQQKQEKAQQQQRQQYQQQKASVFNFRQGSYQPPLPKQQHYQVQHIILQQQQPTKTINQNYDYSFKSFFKQSNPTKKSTFVYDWQK